MPVKTNLTKKTEVKKKYTYKSYKLKKKQIIIIKF